MNKRYISIIVLVLMVTIAYAAKKQPVKKTEAYVDELMQKMTLHEKIGQLNLLPSGPIVTGIVKDQWGVTDKIRRGEVGGLFNLKGTADIRHAQEVAVKESRLGIPLLFGMDVIHGYETVFPIPLALSCSWDMEAIEQSARIAAIEASAAGIQWTFSPMVDICKDGRWGRVAEGNGEDPFLGAAIAKAMVKGYQGDGTYSDPTQIMSCVKHFALYGAAEGGRDYNTVDMSENRMRNEYFPPYKAAVEAGAASVMTSFNDINGIPATCDRWLLEDVLRGEWGFKGFIVTDFAAVEQIADHLGGTRREAAVKALKAGTDLDMSDEIYLQELENAVKAGEVSEAEIDTLCRRVLMAKLQLGLFDDPYRFLSAKREQTDIYNTAHREQARKTAEETFVLLKNQNHLLPLNATGKIALIGPLANAHSQVAGTWSVAQDNGKYSTLFQAMQRYVGKNAEVRYAKGSNFFYSEQMERNAGVSQKELPHGDDKALLEEALETAQWADVIVAALGEPSELSGECASRTNLDMPDAEHDLLVNLLKTGKPVVLLHYSGRPTILSWEKEHVPAIMNVWFGGSESGDAICNVLFGKVSPSGKLTTSFPQSVGQEPFYYNHRNTGRPIEPGKWFEKFKACYIDVSNDAVYPFGYGLSYTQFTYSPVTLSSTKMTKTGNIRASVTVSNTGDYDGDDIVQMYIHDKDASSIRPIKELKGFQRIHLAKGESKTVTFDITPDLLKFYNADMQYVLEPGEFNIMIGCNSEQTENHLITVIE